METKLLSSPSDKQTSNMKNASQLQEQFMQL